MKKLLKKMDVWLSNGDNSRAKLAYLLGYNSSSTIDKWYSIKDIPQRIVPRLEDVLDGKVKVSIIEK